MSAWEKRSIPADGEAGVIGVDPAHHEQRDRRVAAGDLAGRGDLPVVGGRSTSRRRRS
jgi:hypothetical protein